MAGAQRVLTTSRLRLEPLAPEHLPLALALDGDPEVMRYLGASWGRWSTSSVAPDGAARSGLLGFAEGRPA